MVKAAPLGFTGLKIQPQSFQVPNFGPIFEGNRRLADSADSFIKLATNTLTKLNISDQEKRGAAAGLAATRNVPGVGPVPVLPSRSPISLAADAFNKGARSSYTARLEMLIRQKATELGAQHRSDPAAIRTQFDSFAQGLLGTVPPDMRARIELQANALISPHIASAFDKVHAQIKVDTKALVSDGIGELGNEMQNNGRLIAEGGSAAIQAGQNSLSSYSTFMQRIAGMTDGVHLTPATAKAAMTAATIESTKRFLMGAFEGSKSIAEQERLFTSLAAGKLQMPVPFIGEDGKVTIEMRSVGDLLDAQAQNEALTFMGQRLEAQDRSHARRRANTARIQTTEATAQVKAIASQGNSDLGQLAFEGLRANPQATQGQIDFAVAAMKNRTNALNTDYYNQTRQDILNERLTVVTQLLPDRLDNDSMNELMALIDEVQNDNHFTKSVVFRRAEDEIRTVIGGQVATLGAANIVLGSKRNDLRTQAVAKLISDLRRETDDRNRSGMLIGSNKSGQVTEIDPTDPERMIFDPLARARAMVQEIDRKVTEGNKALQLISKQVKEAAAELRDPKNVARAASLAATYSALLTTKRAMKTTLRNAFILEDE